MRLGDHCIYHHEDGSGEADGTVCRVRHNNRFDIRVDGYADLIQMVKLGTGPGECHAPGWEPTRPYLADNASYITVATDAALSSERIPRRRRSIPKWAYPGIFAAGAWFGQLIAYACEVLSR